MKLKKKNLNRIFIFILIFIFLAAIYLVIKSFSVNEKIVLLKTNKGDIEIKLYSDMPITTKNFEKLINEGFYDGILFHRVVDGFMIQAGDPLTKDPTKEKLWGTGGPGYSIKDEFSKKHSNKRGTIAMANAGANTGGSQFFINLKDNSFLDNKHPVFGEVIKGMEVVEEIAKVEVTVSQFGEKSKPIDEVKIISVELKN